MASCRRHVCFSAQTEAATEVDTDALATAEESAPVAAEADAPQNAAADAPAQPPQLSVKWQHILDTQAKGTVCSGKIRGFNKAGVILEVSALKQRGFVPWGKLDLTRLPGPDPNDEDRKKLYGQEVLAKVVQVNIPKRQIIMSEQAVVMHELATSLKGGDVVSGVVKNTTNFGAFISLASPDGKLHGAVGMVHLTELSWNRVGHPDDIVQPGQQVQCRVLKVDAEKDHIYLSMKQLETDPLLENLDGLLPLTLDMPSVGSVPTSLPSAVEDLCAALMREPGIDDVSVGRQVEEKRAVSQDLELWISKEVVEDGYNLVVRTGRLVQEIHVRTQLPGEGMKECVQRVLRQLV